MSSDARYTLGLYDSDTGESLSVSRAVDISDRCHDTDCVLLYADTRKGRIVQILTPYERGGAIGSCIHFSLQSLDAELRAAPGNNTLKSTATRLGLTGEHLVAILRDNSGDSDATA